MVCRDSDEGGGVEIVGAEDRGARTGNKKISAAVVGGAVEGGTAFF